MSNDERADSLAAQAAAWVPPWERAPRTPDRAYQAAAEEQAGAELDDDESTPQREPGATEPGDGSDRPEVVEARASGGAADSGPAYDAPSDTESIDESGLSDDDDDFDPAFEGPEPEPAGVDEAVDAPEQEPIDVAPGPELPLPDAIEDAVEAADEDEPGMPVDAPLPPDGDDAGDVFDQAADDDVSDDGEMDLPFAEELPDSRADDDADSTEEDDLTDEELETFGDDSDDELRSDDPEATGSPENPAFGAAEAPGRLDAPTVAAVEGPGSFDDPARAAVEVPALAGVGAHDAAVPGQTRRVASPVGAVEEVTTRTSEIDLPGLTDDAELAGALEAIMLVVDEPVAELQLAQILEQPTERVAAMLDNLSARYTAAGHGFDLRRVAGGWRLYTRPEYAAYVERFVLDGQSVRLTQAALETLAVVAYKQPVTRSRISAIRGVNCDGVMRTLVTRGLIEECGTESETGAHLYRTTGLFLEKLGLNSVDQLPPLAPFLPDDVEEVLDASG